MTPNCQACGKPVSPIEAAMATQDRYPIHMDCVRRRQRATTSGKCGCRTEKFAKACQTGSRRWLACTRCLGTIRQVS